jgi:hypothetical protein
MYFVRLVVPLVFSVFAGQRRGFDDHPDRPMPALRGRAGVHPRAIQTQGHLVSRHEPELRARLYGATETRIWLTIYA